MNNANGPYGPLITKWDVQPSLNAVYQEQKAHFFVNHKTMAG